LKGGHLIETKPHNPSFTYGGHMTQLSSSGFMAFQIIPLMAQLTMMIFTASISVLILLIPLCVSRAKNIPSHLSVIYELFKNTDPLSKNKKTLALVLILIAGIIPFLTFSLIPFTGIPIVGIFTSALAIIISFILICLAFEYVIDPMLKDGTIANNEKIQSDLDRLKDDYLAVKNQIGPKWNELSDKFKKFMDDHIAIINEFEDRFKLGTDEACDRIVEMIAPSIKDFKLYIKKNHTIEISDDQLAIIMEKIKAWKKVGVSGALSVSVGIGSSAAAKSILIPATLWNIILCRLALSGGILLSPITYSLTTSVLPVAIGVTAFTGSIILFGMHEKFRFSRFMADVIISSMPIIYADGNINEEERALVSHMANQSAIRPKDKDRIHEALSHPMDLDDVCSNHLMHEKNPEKAGVKGRLLISIAWELARADGQINNQEIEMHDRMAKTFGVEEDYVNEVRSILSSDGQASEKV
jgi:uncharacterized tellurite resistance protein B-like protein